LVIIEQIYHDARSKKHLKKQI